VLKPGEQHLTDEELDRLAGISGSSDATELQMPMSDPATAGHISVCLECRQRLDGRIEVTRKLKLLGTPIASGKSEFCQSDEEWMSVAAGLTNNEASQKMLEHATNCDHCGPLLHGLTHDFSEFASLEETRIMAKLDSNSPDWQNRMAARLSASTSLPERKTHFSFTALSWKWAALGCGATAITAILIWLLLPPPERRVEKLIAEAYAERRSLEPRIPGAEFGPVRILRAQQTSHLDSPPSLLAAEKEITSNLRKHPSDPFWLQSRARAELLEGNYSAAIQALQQALAAKPDLPSLLIDLATAYSQRGDATDNPDDYGKAVDLLGQALRASPQDRVALFNRAVVARKALLFSQAIEDWKTYLQVEPTGQWADEARSRMQEAEQEQEKRKHSGVTPLLTPSQFAALSIDDRAAVEGVDERFETYNSIALLEWMPLAYPIIHSESTDSSAARAALAQLATIALERHSDRWWTDLLRFHYEPYFPQAVRYLSNAIKANDSGETEIAHRNATLAIRYFGFMSGNRAGILRARVEELYAFNIEQNANDCSRLLPSFQRDFAQASMYGWLQVEALIQQGNCLWLQENLVGAVAAYSSGAEIAKAGRYQAIFLAAKDHWSMAAGADGDYARAWRLATEGLREFWNGEFDDVRGYNFYYSLYELARLQQEPFLQLSIWKDAIPLTASSRDRAQIAVAHTLVAGSALAAHDITQALHEYEQANQLFAQSPQAEATRLAHLEAETRLAGVELSVGEMQNALSRLRSIETDVAQRSDGYLKMLFYDNYGRALEYEGNTTDAETAFRSAVQLANLQLKSADSANSRIQWKISASEPYRDLISLTFRKGNPEAALELWETFKAAPAWRSSLLPQSTTEPATPDASSVPTVVNQLRDLSQATVISYAVFPTQLVIWTYDNRGVNSAYRNISTLELSTQARSLRELCSNPNSDTQLIHNVGRRLYDQLIGPVESYLQPTRLLIVEPDEKLSDLPMEVLVDSNNHYLGERGPILLSLGGLYEKQQNSESRIDQDTATLVVAVPTSRKQPQAPSLPDVVVEGQAVANRFTNAKLLSGSDATLQHTLEQIPDAGVFHFAGHASNSSVGLLLTDTVLTTRSLERLRLWQTHLVVLSACDTEAGTLGRADAADSLVGYFVRAGVPKVVASRWNVDSAQTHQFMDAFYGFLLVGFSVEESLFRAQDATRGQSPTAHPFYWAAFTVFGSQTHTGVGSNENRK
jgi:CHAT domain-containing protein/tetratricopeptide (TPR) repeat protein